MKKTLFLASLAVVSFSVLGMENVPNFGNDPLHCPEQNRVNVSETNLQNSNIDFSLLNDIDHNIANDSNQPLPTVLNSSNPATEKQETSASQNTDRKGKRRAEESEDVQESAKKIRRDDQSFLDPNVATSSQSAVTEETSSLSSSQEMDNQHTSASPTASPMVLPANQQDISTEKLKEMIELPECPKEYKKAFFNAIKTDFNIDEATAKTIIAELRIFYLEAFRSVRGLTEEMLKKLLQSKKRLSLNKDPIFKDLLTKIREKKDELCNKYKGLFTKNNIRKLIEYHDFMLIHLDDSYSYFYMLAICCNNNTRKFKKILSWLENHNLAEKKYVIHDGEREDILSQIIENKQFEEIQRTYPKLSKNTYNDYVRFIKYWFSFKEQEVFKKKINGEELDKELKPLGLEKSTLDTNALAELIRFGKYYFIEQYKDYDYEYYQCIASVWKILAAKNFEKPNWCNEDAVSEKKVEANKRKSESIKTAQNDTEVARNYLKFIDKHLPLMRPPRSNKKKNVISFYKWKLDKYESMNPKKSIRGTKSEFTKNVVYEEVRKYFDLHGKDMRRIFEPYRGETKELKALKVTNKEAYNRILNERREKYYNIPAENIAAEVDAKIGAYQKKYNILVVLNAARSDKEVNPEALSKSQKIIRDLWEMGFSYKGVIELLGLKDDFTNYRSTTEETSSLISNIEDILSQIIENKQFEKIQEKHPKLSKRRYDNYVRYIKYWFSFKEQEDFKKKINGEELDKELKPLDLRQSTLDTNAVADLIRFGKYYFIEQYKDYDFEYYQYIASVWKILAAKNFEKPNWCDEDKISEQEQRINQNRSESIVIAKKNIIIAWDYLKFIDKNLPTIRKLRPNKKKNVISFYKWKLNEYENFNKDPKKSIRGTDSEFKTNAVYKEVQNYFDLKGDGRDMRNIFEPYRGATKELKALKVTNKEAYNRILNERREEYYNIPAENIAAEVDAKIGAYQKKYNILDVLNDNRSDKEVDPEVQFESQKIIRDLWEMGFSYKGVIELLGLKDDFTNYRSTVENQTGSSSSSSTAQTRKQPATASVPQETNFDALDLNNFDLTDEYLSFFNGLPPKSLPYFNESNNLTNEHSTTSNDVFLPVLNDLPIAQSRNESGWDFNGFHSNVRGSLDMSQSFVDILDAIDSNNFGLTENEEDFSDNSQQTQKENKANNSFSDDVESVSTNSFPDNVKSESTNSFSDDIESESTNSFSDDVESVSTNSFPDDVESVSVDKANDPEVIEYSLVNSDSTLSEDDEGRKVNVTKPIKQSYTPPINQWKRLPKYKQKQIIESDNSQQTQKENEDQAYIKRRDIVLTIINPNYRDDEGRKVNVTKPIKQSYTPPINQWKRLPKYKQKQIIEAVQNDENNSDLGITKTSAGTELDINVIVKIIKAKKGKKTAVLKGIEKRLHQTYLRYAKVWEVLAKEGVIL